MTVRRGSILFVIALIAAAGLTGCTPPSEPGTAPTESAPAPSSAPVQTQAPSPSASAPRDATCASILPPDTVADFAQIGWSSQETPFFAGAVELTDGIKCTWGDFSVPSDHVQIFGWAPITEAVAKTAQDELLSSGWTREDSADGIYVTESASTAMSTDEEGYGITYLFGDGWVTIADTKQGLILIERPGA